MSSWVGNSFKFGRNVNSSLGYIDPVLSRFNPAAKVGDRGLRSVEFSAYPKPPPPPPAPPNPNDAANAARSMTDELRMRRGLLSNIIAGGMSQPSPTTGRTQLGG